MVKPSDLTGRFQQILLQQMMPLFPIFTPNDGIGLYWNFELLHDGFNHKIMCWPTINNDQDLACVDFSLQFHGLIKFPKIAWKLISARSAVVSSPSKSSPAFPPSRVSSAVISKREIEEDLHLWPRPNFSLHRKH